MSVSVVLLHGLGGNFFMLSKVETFLQEKGFDVHKVFYPSRTERLDYCVQYVSDALIELETENNNIVIIGQSAGGLVGSRIPTNIGNKNIVYLITVGSPLRGSKQIRFWNWLIPQFLVNMIEKPMYYDFLDLTNGNREVIIPEYPYHCVTMSYPIPFIALDRAVFRDEAIFDEINNTHFFLCDHDLIFLDPRFYTFLDDLFNFYL